MSFLDSLLLWLLVVGPIAAWVFLFWLTHKNSYSTRHQKEMAAHLGNLNRSLERIAGPREKKPVK
jgi:hypothetical protein